MKQLSLVANSVKSGRLSENDYYATERSASKPFSAKETGLDNPDSPSLAIPPFGREYYDSKKPSPGPMSEIIQKAGAVSTVRGQTDQFEAMYYQERSRAASLSKEVKSLRSQGKKQVVETETMKSGYEEFIRRLQAEMAQLKQSEEKLFQMNLLKAKLEADLKRLSSELSSYKGAESDEVVFELRKIIERLMEERRQLRSSLEVHQSELNQLTVTVNNLREEHPSENASLRSQVTALKTRFDSLNTEYIRLKNTPVVAPQNAQLEALLREKVNHIQILESKLTYLNNRLREKSQDTIYCRLCTEKDTTIRSLSERVRFLESRPTVIREVSNNFAPLPPRPSQFAQQAVTRVSQTIVQPPIQKIVRAPPIVVTRQNSQRMGSNMSPLPVQSTQRVSNMEYTQQVASRSVVSQFPPVITRLNQSPGVVEYKSYPCRCLASHGHCYCCNEYGGYTDQEVRPGHVRRTSVRRSFVGQPIRSASVEPSVVTRLAPVYDTTADLFRGSPFVDTTQRTGYQYVREVRTAEPVRPNDAQAAPRPPSYLPPNDLTLPGSRIQTPGPRSQSNRNMSFGTPELRLAANNGQTASPSPTEYLSKETAPMSRFAPPANYFVKGPNGEGRYETDIDAPANPYQPGERPYSESNKTNRTNIGPNPATQPSPAQLNSAPQQSAFADQNKENVLSYKPFATNMNNPFIHESYKGLDATPSVSPAGLMPPTQQNSIQGQPQARDGSTEYGANRDGLYTKKTRDNRLMDHVFNHESTESYAFDKAAAD